MNISRTTLGRHIKKNNLKAGDEVTDFVLSVSEATSNKWSSANWIAYGKGYVVTSYAIEQLTSGKAEPKPNRPWSREAIPDIKERMTAVREALVAEMTRRGYKCGTIGREPNQVLSVHHLNEVSTDFHLRAEWSGGYSRSKEKLRMSYGGDYYKGHTQHAQQRPEPKDGFDINLICDDLEKVVVSRIKRNEQMDQDQARLKASTAIAEEINGLLGIGYGSITCRGTSHHSDKVRVKIDLYLSPKDAEAVMRLAKEAEDK